MPRRLTAFVLFLCLGFFSLEALVADVCDGDAPAAEVARLSADFEAHPELASAVAAAGQDDASAPAAPEAPSHDTHACHCGHTHQSITAALIQPAWRLAPSGKAPAAPGMRPPSADRGAALRPPIA